MDRDDIIRMAREAYISEYHLVVLEQGILRFANLVTAAEREKVAHWMQTACYATGHGDTTEDLLRELAWQADERIAKAVAAEREECAKVCDQISDEDGFEGSYADRCAFAIRARGNNEMP